MRELMWAGLLIVGVMVAGTALIVATAFLVTSRPATEAKPARVEKVAERDGVTIYRFWDADHPRYYGMTKDGTPVPVSGR